MRNEVLKVDNIEKYYGNKSNITKAINNISFTVEEGEFVGVMGASGSGKTTLLNCISTIDKVSSGHILINNNDITKLNSKKIAKFRREELGFIFQDFNLLDTLTCYENIALALTISRVNHKEIEMRVKEISSKLGIIEILNKYPYEVSGGQKQRVACARAIITKPSLILADEPTGNYQLVIINIKQKKRVNEVLPLQKFNSNILFIIYQNSINKASPKYTLIFIRK